MATPNTKTEPPEWLAESVADVADFPEPGIMFKDLSPLWASSANTSRCAVALAADAPSVDAVVGIEARGFLAGLATAQRLGVGFVAARKPGKLPGNLHQVSYDLEYGSDALELQIDALDADMTVMVVDDVLATGGTMAAACELVELSGASVAAVRCVIELAFLNGRDRLAGHDVRSLWAVT